MNGLFFFCGVLAIASVALIAVYMIVSGIPAIHEIGLLNFLTGEVWASTAAEPKFGILPFILTSVYGTAAATLIGVPVGLLTATSRIGRGILDPLVEFIRPLPPLAYLPLIIIWCGIGEGSKILVIGIAMLAPIVISTVSGVKAAGENQIRAARTFGATRWQLIREVMLPAALPSIFTGMRIALGAGWTTLVASELVAATRGLGYMIQSAAQFLVTDMVIAGILVISALATISELILRQIERRYLPWIGKA